MNADPLRMVFTPLPSFNVKTNYFQKISCIKNYGSSMSPAKHNRRNAHQ